MPRLLLFTVLFRDVASAPPGGIRHLAREPFSPSNGPLLTPRRSRPSDRRWPRLRLIWRRCGALGRVGSGGDGSGSRARTESTQLKLPRCAANMAYLRCGIQSAFVQSANSCTIMCVSTWGRTATCCYLPRCRRAVRSRALARRRTSGTRRRSSSHPGSSTASLPATKVAPVRLNSLSRT